MVWSLLKRFILFLNRWSDSLLSTHLWTWYWCCTPQLPNAVLTFEIKAGSFYLLNLWWNEEIGHDWPWNCLRVNSPNYVLASENGRLCITMAAFHTLLMQAESLHFNHVMFHFKSAVVAPQCSVAGRWSAGHNMDISTAFMFDFSRVISKGRIFFWLNKMQISSSPGLGVIITHQFVRWAVLSEGWKFNWGNEVTGGGPSTIRAFQTQSNQPD